MAACACSSNSNHERDKWRSVCLHHLFCKHFWITTLWVKISKIIPSKYYLCFLSSQDHLETPTNPLCGEPDFAQHVPRHTWRLQLPAASSGLRPLGLQGDPHPGLHRFPAAHERPAAHHWKRRSHPEWVTPFCKWKPIDFSKCICLGFNSSLFLVPADVFFSLSFAMMVVSLLVTLFIVHVHFHSSYFSVVPRWLSVLVLQYVAPAICLSQRKHSNNITLSLPQREGKLNDFAENMWLWKFVVIFQTFKLLIHHSCQESCWQRSNPL